MIIEITAAKLLVICVVLLAWGFSCVASSFEEKLFPEIIAFIGLAALVVGTFGSLLNIVIQGW